MRLLRSKTKTARFPAVHAKQYAGYEDSFKLQSPDMTLGELRAIIASVDWSNVSADDAEKATKLSCAWFKYACSECCELFDEVVMVEEDSEFDKENESGCKLCANCLDVAMRMLRPIPHSS